MVQAIIDYFMYKNKKHVKNIKMQQFNTFLNKQGKNRKQHSNSLKFLQVSCKLKQKREHRLPLICNTFVSFLFSTFNFLVFKRPFPFLNDLKIIFFWKHFSQMWVVSWIIVKFLWTFLNSSIYIPFPVSQAPGF